MKLKQRVIMMSTLFLTMITLFLIGAQFSWIKEESPSPPPSDGNSQRSEDKISSVPTVSQESSHNKLLDRLSRGNSRSPHELLNKILKEQAELGKVPHKGRFPLADLAIDPIIKINPWEVWSRWVRPECFYPDGAFYSEEMNQILHAMATTPVTEFGVGHKGTQLKASMILGQQRTVFKPKRYGRDEVIEGNPYAGFDRHNGEIAGFHLDGILGFRLAPPVVGRKINLTALHSVTSEKLLATYLNKGKDTCFYGECYYCKPAEAACAEGEIMEGSVTLWLPEWYQLKTKRHPYQRTYRADRQARWEKDNSFCRKNILTQTSEFFNGVLEYTDTAVYDFLMGNADRHHYEVYAKAQLHGKLVHIDNGKTFGNPHHDEMSILAPLTQCCRLRSSTWGTLQSLESSNESLSETLDKSLHRDPLYPILSQEHLTAIDRRLNKVLAAVRQCIDSLGQDVVIVDSWPLGG